MTKSEASQKVRKYFSNNSISYKFLNEEDKPVLLDSLDTVYLCAEIPEVIGRYIETSIRFREESLYCQTYYCQPVVHNEEDTMKAAKMVNYLNMNYSSHWLCEHTFVLDEDTGDIFNACMIRYELLEKYFYESMDYILNYLVQQLVDVCVPIIFYIIGKYSYFEATKVEIDHKLMGKPVDRP